MSAKTGMPSKLSTFRKLAIHTWSRPVYPAIYTRLVLDYTPWHLFLKANYHRSGISVNHVIGWVFANILTTYPHLNRQLRWGKLYPRDAVTLFFPTHLNTPDGHELSGITIPDVATESLLTVSRRIRHAVSALKTTKTVSIHQTYSLIRWLPTLITRPALYLASFITDVLGIKLPYCPPDPFGSIIITSLGSLGLSDAYVPLYPLARSALLVAVGKPTQVSPGRWELVLNITLDHRYVDGADLVRPLAHLNRMMATPAKYCL